MVQKQLLWCAVVIAIMLTKADHAALGFGDPTMGFAFFACPMSCGLQKLSRDNFFECVGTCQSGIGRRRRALDSLKKSVVDKKQLTS